MKIRHDIINFSDCDDNEPRGDLIADGDDPKKLFAYANDHYTCGDFFVAFDDTSKKTGQGPYYLYNLDDSPDA